MFKILSRKTVLLYFLIIAFIIFEMQNSEYEKEEISSRDQESLQAKIDAWQNIGGKESKLKIFTAYFDDREGICKMIKFKSIFF